MNISKQIIRVLSALLVISAVAFAAQSCKDNEDPEPSELNFNGSVTSSLVDNPNFEPYTFDNVALHVVWQDEKHTLADVTVGEFKVLVAQMNREITIPEMAVNGVPTTKQKDGSYKLHLDNFEVQVPFMGTPMVITGQLDGEVTCCSAHVEVVYKPGVMPFTVKSVFEGK